MSNSKLVYETEHARAWIDEPTRGPYWEIRTKHPHSGEDIWTHVSVQIHRLSELGEGLPLAGHRANQPAGTRELWIVPGDGHLLAPHELVVERFVAQKPGGLFWFWRFYVRHPNPLPGADFQYESHVSDDARTHGYAALHVLTHPPDMVVMPGGAR